jgi:tRNA(Ile)-lysidine synthetase-like protein
MIMTKKLRSIKQKLLSKLTKAPKCNKLAVAVSGGCDSVALLLLMKDWCGINGVELCIFHVDHQMRGNSSADAAWVEGLAKELGLEFYSRLATEEDKSRGTHLGQEGWARNFRYTSFASMVKEAGADLIATGHNAEDQAETVLMRILRGCSLQGLHGIRAKGRLKFGNGTLRLWRPILCITRQEIEKFVTAAGTGWREDETNATGLYLRNRLRHQLIPALEEAHGGAISHIIALGEDAREVQEYLSARAQKYLNTHSDGAVLWVKRRPRVVLRREILRQWLGQNGVSDGITRGFIERLDDLWVRGRSKMSVCHRVFRVSWRGGRLEFHWVKES